MVFCKGGRWTERGKRDGGQSVELVSLERFPSGRLKKERTYDNLSSD